MNRSKPKPKGLKSAVTPVLVLEDLVLSLTYLLEFYNFESYSI